MWRTEQKVANMLVEIKDNRNLVSKELEDIRKFGDTVSKDLNELNVLRSKKISDLNQLMETMLRTEQKVANILVEIKDNRNLDSKELEDIKNIRGHGI